MNIRGGSPLFDFGREPSSTGVEKVIEACGECGVEVVRVPRHPVVAVEDVGVGVVPRPMHKLHSHYVVWDVHEDCHQTDGEGFRVFRQPELRHGVCGVVDKGRI